MPQTGAKHVTQRIVQLDSFIGGMNQSMPATQIADNECQLIQNMFLDPRSGKPRSRYPITRYSNSAPSYGAGPVNSLYFWNNSWFFSCNQHLYYLDSSNDPVHLGNLNGSSRPTYAPYNDKLIIASGGAMQYTTSSYADLANVSSGKTCSVVMERFSRVAAAVDTTYPDRIWESNYFSETTWGSSDYADVGYKDGTSVIGLAEAFEGMYIVFKRGYSGLKTYYCTTLSASAPAAALVSDNHSAFTHASIVNANSKIYLIEKHYVSSLEGVDTQGKVVYNHTPGLKLSHDFEAKSTAFAVSYPRDSQIWFVPNPLTATAYIYHYNLKAWTKFNFGQRLPYSAFYDPVNDYLYLGCDDGYIYKYDWASQTYSDTAGAYTQILVTKVFTGNTREIVVKSPIVYWSDLTSGSGTIYISGDYGSTTKFSGTLSLNDFQVYVYDTQAGGNDELYVYNTRLSGSGERFVYSDYSSYSHQVVDYNDVMDNLQIKLEISSGAMILERVVLEIADSRRIT